MGVTGPIIDWLRMLYDKLEYIVRHHDDLSDSFSATLGILIGDPASPLLWLLYLADLDITTYPDDIRLHTYPVMRSQRL